MLKYLVRLHFVSFIFRFISFEILNFVLCGASFNTFSINTRDLYTLEKKFSSHRLSASNLRYPQLSSRNFKRNARNLSCTGFHVPHLAYQGILLQTRLIRLVTENRGAERDREKLTYIYRRHKRTSLPYM